MGQLAETVSPLPPIAMRRPRRAGGLRVYVWATAPLVRSDISMSRADRTKDGVATRGNATDQGWRYADHSGSPATRKNLPTRFP